MIKELIVAIALGSLLGFGITGGYFAIKKNSVVNSNEVPTPTIFATTSQSPTISVTQDNSPELTTTNDHIITIESPENNFLSNNSKITIKGNTSKNSFIYVTTNVNIFSSKADKSGYFEVEIDLESGANLLKIASISENDEQAKAEITITYSTAKI